VNNAANPVYAAMDTATGDIDWRATASSRDPDARLVPCIGCGPLSSWQRACKHLSVGLRGRAEVGCRSISDGVPVMGRKK
jgi:hypothetical protein